MCYDRGFLTRMLAESGFTIERFHYGEETDGRSAVYARRQEDGTS